MQLVLLMTSAGDQVASITITNGGYGILKPLMERTIYTQLLHLQMLRGDTTGSGAVAYAILGWRKFGWKLVEHLIELRALNT